MSVTEEIKHLKLGDITSLSQGLAINSKTKHLLKNKGIPLLRIKDLINNQVEQYIDTENAPGKCLASKSDIIYTRTGQVGLVFNDREGVIHNNCFKVIPDETIVNKKFLYWFLFQKKVRDYAINIASGSVQKDLNHSSFASIPIKLPSLKHQEKAAKILDKLKRKIELNQKMNETLEEIAKTLFKSWFIDFDPVRAKAEGRPTGLSKEISDLFPDSFEDSELGEIPRGWSKSIITDIANKISDKYKKDEGWSNEKLIDLSRMPSNSISLTSHGRGDELSTSVCKFKKYDFLFGSIRPYFYKAGICPYDGVSNTSVFILRAKKSYDKEFMYFYSSSDITFERSVQYSDGTKMPIIKWNDFKEFPFALPNEELRKQFSSIINPVVDKIILNIDEQKVLSELRDALLPRLISGELQITDAENLVEEAGI